MDQPSNTDEAREAFMRHVFGDMMQLELKIKEAGLQISASVEELRSTKTSLSRGAERLLWDVLAGIDRSAKSISGSEERVASAAADAARKILLGEDGPVKRLNLLADRLLLREAEATKWVKKAMTHSTSHWPTALVAAAVGGFMGGIVGTYF